jgi:hypothetical protein
MMHTDSEYAQAVRSGGPIGGRSTLSETSAPTSMSVAGRALEESRNLAFRVSSMVDRLCGCTPQAVDPEKPVGPSQSAFDSLKRDAQRTLEVLREAEDQLNRLEREIP